MTPQDQNLPPKLEKILQKFQRITEPKRRYEYLLWFAKRVPSFPDADKISAHRVPGCVSQVYLTASLQDGGIVYRADADAQIPKGLVGLLMEGLNGVTPEEVVQLSPEFIQRTGLDVSLTPISQQWISQYFPKDEAAGDRSPVPALVPNVPILHRIR